MRRITTKVLFVLAVLTMAAGIAWAKVNFHNVTIVASDPSSFTVSFTLVGLGNTTSSVDVTLTGTITCQANGQDTSSHKTTTVSFPVTNGTTSGTISLTCPGHQTFKPGSASGIFISAAGTSVPVS